MRFIGAAAIGFVVVLPLTILGFAPETAATDSAAGSREASERSHRYGQAIFRYDTFGDEQLWTDVLRMHEVIRRFPRRWRWRLD